MSDFAALGELIIDFTPAGEQNGKKLYMQNAGGAVANVAAAISGFGASASFLGMVGNDFFGRHLEKVLSDKGVDTKGLVLSDEYNTTLAFVNIDSNGDRDFTFYREPGADMMYHKKFLDFEEIRKAKVFHFGSLSLTNEPAREATFEAVDFAKRNGVAVSYDPNYREPLWKDEKRARKYIYKGIEYADILKISDTEAVLLFGSIPYEDTLNMLLDKGIKLVFITLGSEGALYANAKGMGRIKAYAAKVVDTTGAGDCFTAGVIYKYINCGKTIDNIILDDVHDFADFASAAASLCIESFGGIPSMPKLENVLQRLKQ